MKEHEPKRPSRPYLVCYNEFKCIGWKNVTELHKLLNDKGVDWYMEQSTGNVTNYNHGEKITTDTA